MKLRVLLAVVLILTSVLPNGLAVINPVQAQTMEVLKNYDFENGTTQKWGPRGVTNDDVAVSTEAANNGSKYSLLTTGRKDTWQGPSLDVSGIFVKGVTYEISCYVKLAKQPAGESTVKLSIDRSFVNNPDGNKYPEVGRVKISNTDWTKIEGTYTFADDISSQSLYVESSDANDTYYIDDVEIKMPSATVQDDLKAVKEVYKDTFKIGAAINPSDTVGEVSKLLLKHYNSVVAENAMKPESLAPEEGKYTWTDADSVAKFAYDNGMNLRLHTLVWHSQTKDWFFKDKAGNDMTLETNPVKMAENKELLLNRLRTYITDVIEHFGSKYKIGDIDVVNEVIDAGEPDGLRNSKWHQLTDKDFIKVAFTTAREVLNKNGWNGTQLYINDYDTNQPGKCEALYKLVKELKDEGVPIDGVGHQTHIKLSQPSVSSIIASIKRFGELGLKNQLTELDMSMYDNYGDNYKEIGNVPESVLVKQGYRYKELMEGLLSVKEYVNNVTWWGISDANTWLSTFQVTRLEMPVLFNKYYQAKPAYWGVVDPSKLPILVKNLGSTKGTPVIDGKSEVVWDATSSENVSFGDNSNTTFKTLWDENNLYLLVDVDDAKKNDNDKLDIFVYDNKSKKINSYEVNRSGKTTGEAVSVVTENKNGYVAEVVIPLSETVKSGDSLNIDIRFNDADSKTIASWNDPTNTQDDVLKIGKLTLNDQIGVVDAVYGTPVIDGERDSIWLNAPEIKTEKLIDGKDGSKAKVRAVWDSVYLYVYAEVQDNLLSKKSPNPWEQDSVEIFIDENFDKTKVYNNDDAQYRINYDNEQTFGSNAYANKLQSVTKIVYGGYLVEAAIKLELNKPAAGKLIGFDIQVNNDETGSGSRFSTISWNDKSGQMYQDNSNLGILRFLGSDVVIAKDKTELTNKIDEAKSVTQEIYTQDTVKVLKLRIREAEKVNSYDKATQGEVEDALANLKASIEGLKKIDKTVLAEKIKEAQALLSRSYTTTTWDVFQSRLREATAVNEKESPTQIEVDTAYKNLVDAISGLQKKKSSGGGGAVAMPNTNSDSNTSTKAKDTYTTPKVSVEGNKVIAKYEMTDLSKAFEQAQKDENGIKTIIAEVKKSDNAEGYIQQLPVKALAAQNLEQKIQIKTPVADITLPGNMLGNMKDIGGEVIGLEIAAVNKDQLKEDIKEKIGNRPVIQLNAKVGDKTIAWNNPSAKVKVAIDYTPSAEEKNNPENVVVYYINDEGKATVVPNGKYDAATGKVTFTVTHFSQYAIGFVLKTFEDLESAAWAKKQIEVLAAKGIINGTSETTFNPTNNIKRADFICLLVKALELDAEVDSNFKDVDSDKYYYKPVGVAKKLGMSKGFGDDLFMPEEEISRQDMMVLVDKALELAGNKLAAGVAEDVANFTDSADVAGYAVNSVATLVKGGVVKGSENMLNPKGRTTRAEVASILYNLYNK